VAAVNSFKFLQNTYPLVYGPLIPEVPGQIPYDNLRAVAERLLLPEYMNTRAATGGTDWLDFIKGKEKYIREKTGDNTIFEAQAEPGLDAAGRTVPDYVERRWPTFQFLYQNLVSGQDIEIFAREQGSNKGHFVTVVGVHWTDRDMDGIIDEDENAQLEFLDPVPSLDTGLAFKSKRLVQNGEDAPLYLDTLSGLWEIRMAVKESPDLPRRAVPGAASFLLCVLGLGVVVVVRGLRPTEWGT